MDDGFSPVLEAPQDSLNDKGFVVQGLVSRKLQISVMEVLRLKE